MAIVEQCSWLNSTVEGAFSLHLKHACIFSSGNGKTNISVGFETMLKAGNKRMLVIAGGGRIAIAVSLCIAEFGAVLFHRDAWSASVRPVSDVNLECLRAAATGQRTPSRGYKCWCLKSIQNHDTLLRKNIPM